MEQLEESDPVPAEIPDSFPIDPTEPPDSWPGSAAAGWAMLPPVSNHGALTCPHCGCQRFRSEGARDRCLACLRLLGSTEMVAACELILPIAGGGFEPDEDDRAWAAEAFADRKSFTSSPADWADYHAHLDQVEPRYGYE
jgi:hypothetical protein